ncbi:MAG: FAD-binding oxidoreductase [Mycoplasmoidaceae bacterium]
MKSIRVEIIDNKKLSQDYYKISFNIKKLMPSENIMPGNFFMISTSDQSLILKRPLAVYSYDKANGVLEFVYKIIGKGTKSIANIEKGNYLQIIGPLGNIFPIVKNKNILIIAGGAGLFPLYYYAKNNCHSNNIIFISGVKTKSQLPIIQDLDALNINNIYYSEDNTLNYQGYATSDIKEIIKKHNIEIILCCGPEGMMLDVFNKTKNLDILSYGSYENRMGCGFGACMGCSIKTKKSMARVCLQGPIFLMKDVYEEQ